MMTSTASARAAALAATCAPAGRRGSTLAAVRFHTHTSCPTSNSRSAIAVPILPTPAMPIRMAKSFSLNGVQSAAPALPLACGVERCRSGIGTRCHSGIDLGQDAFRQQHHRAAGEVVVEPILARIEQRAALADLGAEFQDL